MKRVLAVLTVVCAMAVPACADFVSDGPGVETGSWTQGWTENGVGPFDHYQFMIDAPNLFETPAFSGTLGDGWSQTANNGAIVLADGPSVTSENFFLTYLPSPDSPSTPLLVHMQAWNGTDLVDNMDASWNGGGWSYLAGTWNTARLESLSAVPEPSALAALFSLGGIGLVGLVWRRRRRA